MHEAIAQYSTQKYGRNGDMCSKISQTCNVEVSTKINNGWNQLTIFEKICDLKCCNDF